MFSIVVSAVVFGINNAINGLLQFQSKSSEGVDNNACSLLLCGVNDDER